MFFIKPVVDKFDFTPISNSSYAKNSDFQTTTKRFWDSAKNILIL